MKYLCLSCHKMLDEKTDYCCENNRLIVEVDYEKPKKLEQAYVALQNGSITLMDYLKILKDENSN